MKLSVRMVVARREKMPVKTNGILPKTSIEIPREIEITKAEIKLSHFALISIGNRIIKEVRIKPIVPDRRTLQVKREYPRRTAIPETNATTIIIFKAE
jgi:hypothetical protein